MVAGRAADKATALQASAGDGRVTQRQHTGGGRGLSAERCGAGRRREQERPPEGYVAVGRKENGEIIYDSALHDTGADFAYAAQLMADGSGNSFQVCGAQRNTQSEDGFGVWFRRRKRQR